MKVIKYIFLSFVVCIASISFNYKSFANDVLIENNLEFIALNEFAGSYLGQELKNKVSGNDVIVTTSFVSLSNFEQTSPFGQLASQQIATRLEQLGYFIADIRLGQALRVDAYGEFILSRDAKTLASSINAHAVMVGTYTTSRRGIFVSARVIRLSDSSVIAAYEYLVPMNNDVRALLVGSSGSSSTAGAPAAWSQYSRRNSVLNKNIEQNGKNSNFDVESTKSTTKSTKKSNSANVTTEHVAKPTMGPVKRKEQAVSKGYTEPISSTITLPPGAKIIDPNSPAPKVGKPR